MCAALKCDLGDTKSLKGVTNNIPALDGTSCGKSRREVSGIDISSSIVCHLLPMHYTIFDAI